MLVFSITVLVVAALLALDRFYPKLKKEPIKYTNLDWEVVDNGYYDGYRHYYGHIYSVVKNKVVTAYRSQYFDDRSKAEQYIKKICKTMRTEYGLIEIPSTQDAYVPQFKDLYANLIRR